MATTSVMSMPSPSARPARWQRRAAATRPSSAATGESGASGTPATSSRCTPQLPCCPICLDFVDASSESGDAGLPCGHAACATCIVRWLESLVNEGRVSSTDICCPLPACRQPFGEDFPARLLRGPWAADAAGGHPERLLERLLDFQARRFTPGRKHVFRLYILDCSLSYVLAAMLRVATSCLHKPVAIGPRALQTGEKLASCRRYASVGAVQQSVSQTRKLAAKQAPLPLRRHVAFQSVPQSIGVVNGVRAPTHFVETELVHGDINEMPAVRAIEDAPPEVLTFGDMSASVIRAICRDSVPGWNTIPEDNISIDQLCEGLSNQNFKVYLKSKSSSAVAPCVLFRVYGKDADTLYNGDRELQIVKLLSSYQIGPTVYANGDGWRIEEWHFSVPLPNHRMRNPAIFTQVAAHLGRLHKLSARSDFPADISRGPVLSSERLARWAEGSQKAAAMFQHPASIEAVASLNLNDVLKERDWLARFVVADDPGIRGAGLDKVFSHWDNQENNILQTHYGLRFIDFEYSGMEHQAFDIATYFSECAIDYLVDAHPFFKVSMSELPTEAEQRLFCSIYLSEYLETTVRPDELAVSVLYERVQRFNLLVNYVWTLWSVIRAPQAPTYNAFDYLKFAQQRYFMYKWGKRTLLHSSAASP